MTAPDWEETPIGACTRDPERWTTRADEAAKAICRGCPRRWQCAREAWELPPPRACGGGSSSPRVAAVARLHCANCVPWRNAMDSRSATADSSPNRHECRPVRRRYWGVGGEREDGRRVEYLV